MAPNHKVTVLYSFAGPPDAANPSGPLLLDKSGNPYGTSVWGGTSNQGTVFKLTSAGDETVLYSFAGYPQRMNLIGSDYGRLLNNYRHNSRV